MLVRGLDARTNTRTGWPASRNAFAMADPTKPLAPVTSVKSKLPLILQHPCWEPYGLRLEPASAIRKPASPYHTAGSSRHDHRRAAKSERSLRAEEARDQRLDLVEFLPLRNVAGARNDLHPRIRDPLGKVLGIDRRDQRVLFSPYDQCARRDDVQTFFQPHVGYRPDYFSGRAQRPDRVRSHRRQFLGVGRYLEQFLHRGRSELLG